MRAKAERQEWVGVKRSAKEREGGKEWEGKERKRKGKGRKKRREALNLGEEEKTQEAQSQEEREKPWIPATQRSKEERDDEVASSSQVLSAA